MSEQRDGGKCIHCLHRTYGHESGDECSVTSRGTRCGCTNFGPFAPANTPETMDADTLAEWLRDHDVYLGGVQYANLEDLAADLLTALAPLPGEGGTP